VFGRYLLNEIKRAGTVEILHGQTSDKLKALVALRRRCTALGGYDKGEPRRVYELSHVWPVVATSSLGLLDADNLVITPKEFNRRHGQKFPVTGYQGKSIPRSSVSSDWDVKEGMKPLEILKLVRRYLGAVFDTWLSSYVITASQREVLIKNLVRAGLSKSQLLSMRTSQLRSLSEEEELPYFDLNKDPTEILSVVIEELKRLSLGSELLTPLELILEEEWELVTPDKVFRGSTDERNELRKMLIDQALLCLHGQPYCSMWNSLPAINWFAELIKSEKVTREIEDDDRCL
jgi:hypothetical protein